MSLVSHSNDLAQTPLSNHIVIGSMFFQSISGLMQDYGEYSQTVFTLIPNTLAMGTPFEGTLTDDQNQKPSDTNPFAVPEVKVPDGTMSVQGLQSFNAQLTGINSTLSPNFYIDFTNNNTVVWAQNCTNALTNQSCSESPLFLNASYVNLTKPIGHFTNMTFSGYQVSGHIYYDYLCFGANYSCQLTEVYAGELVSVDELLLNENGAFGVLGYGPQSKLWEAAINYTG